MEDGIKQELVALYNNKTLTEAQIVIAKNALSEVRSDYEFASGSLPDDHIECPSCGADYQNSFAERFAIALDEERCSQLLQELTDDLEKIDEGIAAANRKYGDVSKKAVRATELLMLLR